MDDLALHERVAERREAGLRVKPDGVVLRVERRAREATGAGVGDERIEQNAPDPATAGVLEHRHPADLRGTVGATIVAAGSNDRGAGANDGVARAGIGAVVVVDLFFGRHALLVNEHRETHGQRRRHPFAIGNVEEFGRRKR